MGDRDMSGLYHCKMKRIPGLCLALFVAVWAIAAAQDPFDLPRVDQGKREPRLPNGKSQRDAIAKDDFKRNSQDADELMRLSAELKDDLDKSGSQIVSVKTLKKLDDIEKLARGIRGRLKRQ